MKPKVRISPRISKELLQDIVNKQRRRMNWLRDKLMMGPVETSNSLGLPQGWCGSLEDAIDHAMQLEELGH